VSSSNRVGIDIEIPVDKIRKIMYKFLSPAEMDIFNTQETLNDLSLITTLWSCKEAVFKWYGDGGVDFKKDIRLSGHPGNEPPLYCQFKDNTEPLLINHHVFDQLVLAWTFS
jgi:phosphopantetheinyl transferase